MKLILKFSLLPILVLSLFYSSFGLAVPVNAAGCEVRFGALPMTVPWTTAGQNFELLIVPWVRGEKYNVIAVPYAGSPGKEIRWQPITIGNDKTYLRIDEPGVYSIQVEQITALGAGKTCFSGRLAIVGKDPTCPANSEWKGDLGARCCKDKNSGRCVANDKVKCNDLVANRYLPGFGCYNASGVTTPWEFNNTCDNGTTGIQTAIGCVPTKELAGSRGFLAFLLRWAFGAAGGVILLMLILTGYNLLTSQGNPEKLQAVKENLVSLLSGVVLIVFSLVLLRVIGVDILGLPGFTGP